MSSTESVLRLLEEMRLTYSRVGWNRTGSNLLASTAFLANSGARKARRIFLDWDIFVILVGMASLIVIQDTVSDLAFFVGLVSISYMIRKRNKVDLDFLVQNLSRAEQKVLVLKLVDLCEKEGVDHEDLQSLALNINVYSKFCDDSNTILEAFIDQDTKFYTIDR